MKPLPGIGIEAIENHAAVLGVFGAWPSFHDGEIHSLILDRSGPDGPYIEICAHVFTCRPDLDCEGRYVRDKEAMVSMRFAKIESAEIVGFNEQNAIFRLDIERDEDRIRVVIHSSYGCSASFLCRQVSIREVVPKSVGGGSA